MWACPWKILHMHAFMPNQFCQKCRLPSYTIMSSYVGGRRQSSGKKINPGSAVRSLCVQSLSMSKYGWRSWSKEKVGRSSLLLFLDVLCQFHERGRQLMPVMAVVVEATAADFVPMSLMELVGKCLCLWSVTSWGQCIVALWKHLKMLGFKQLKMLKTIAS